MSYAPGAPAAVWAIPSSVLGAGAKLTLMALWSKADHADQKLHEACTVWFAAVEGETPSASLLLGLAAKTGTKPRAVRQHLTKLRGLGLVVTHGRLVVLTPTCRACHESVAACRCSVDVLASLADADMAEADAFVSRVDAAASLQLNPPVPSVPPNPGEDASARPPTPCSGVAAVWCANCGDCTCRRDHEHPRHSFPELDPACPLHGDASTHPTPSPEEHPHGDTTNPEPARIPQAHLEGDGACGREHALRGTPAGHALPAARSAGPKMRDQHAGGCAVPEPRGPAVPGLRHAQAPAEPGHAARPGHVQRSLTRATGDDARGARDHRGRGDLEDRIRQADLEDQARLDRIAARRAHGPDEAAHAFEQAVAQVGAAWSQLIQDRPSWRQCMHKARVDENLTAEHGRRICEAWDTEATGGVKPGQPARSKIWGGWSTDADWRRKAAGLGLAVQLYAVPDEREPIDDPWDGHGDVGS